MSKTNKKSKKKKEEKQKFQDILSKYAKSEGFVESMDETMKIIKENKIEIIRQSATVLQLYMELGVKDKSEKLLHFFESVVSMSYTEGYKKAKKKYTAN